MLEKHNGMGLGMGLSDAEFRTTVLTVFSLHCPYTQFAPFFGHLVKCRAGGRPRQWLSSARALDPNAEWAWAANHLAPQKSLMCSNDKTIRFNFVFSPNIFIINLFIIFFKSHIPDLRIIYYL